MSQKYIHCSWDILEPGSLIPRIPKSRVIGPNISEDDSTPIIASSILALLNAGVTELVHLVL